MEKLTVDKDEVIGILYLQEAKKGSCNSEVKQFD